MQLNCNKKGCAVFDRRCTRLDHNLENEPKLVSDKFTTL